MSYYTVVERGIDSYVLHTDLGSVRIETPLHEKRIAAVHRGSGPRGTKEMKWRSFDGYLLELAMDKGARLVRGRVMDIDWKDGLPQVKIQGGLPQAYNLLVVATGVNTSALKLFEKLDLGYASPVTSKTYISEFHMGQETVERYLGSSTHVFLLNLPRLEFAALIPKGDYVTLCLLGVNFALPRCGKMGNLLEYLWAKNSHYFPKRRRWRPFLRSLRPAVRLGR